MKRSSFSLPSFRVPTLHFRRKSTPTNADNCPACHSTQLRRTHAFRQRVQSVASLHLLPNAYVPAKWKDENNIPARWKCNDCGWIGIKGEANTPATYSHNASLPDLPPVPSVPVTPAVPWQQFERVPSPHSFAPTSSPAQSTPSLPGVSSPPANGNSRRRHRPTTSGSMSPKSAWSKFAGSFSGNSSSGPAGEMGVLRGRPEPITEMNPLYQAAEKWHRPPSFIFHGINGGGTGSGAGADASKSEKGKQGGGKGGRVPKWLYMN